MINPNDDHLPYAIDDASGNLISISAIPPERRGLACRCHCAKCNESLVAKLGFGGKKPHFAHQKASHCHGANITFLHILSENILMEEKAVMVPKYKIIPARKLFFTHVEVEKRNDRTDLQPDIVGITEDGLRWHIEIKNTSQVNDRKTNKIKESQITCLEIDVSEQTLDKEKLRTFLLDSTESRRWINNPIYDKKIREERYGDEAIQREKFRQYKIDKKYDIVELRKCGSNCGINRLFGKCIYQIDELCVNNVEYVFCDSNRREMDKNDSPKISVPPIIANHQEEPECHYLIFDYNQQSMDELCELLKERRSIATDDGLSGEIERCEIRSKGHDIVCLCHCNDRVYPLKVIIVCVENNQLRYEIKSNNQGKDKDLADRNYKKIRDGDDKKVASRYKKKKDQDNIFAERNDCPF
jgi:hypothetical protein